MKVEQTPKRFQPITVTLETEDEAHALYLVTNYATVLDKHAGYTSYRQKDHNLHIQLLWQKLHDLGIRVTK